MSLWDEPAESRSVATGIGFARLASLRKKTSCQGPFSGHSWDNGRRKVWDTSETCDTWDNRPEAVIQSLRPFCPFLPSHTAFAKRVLDVVEVLDVLDVLDFSALPLRQNKRRDCIPYPASALRSPLWQSCGVAAFSMSFAFSYALSHGASLSQKQKKSLTPFGIKLL